MTAPPRTWRLAHSECSLGWGGQEHRVLAELRGFQKRGSQVWLLAPRSSRIYERAQAEGIRALHFEAGRSKFPFEIFRLARWLRQNQIQILNPHSSRDGWLLGVAGRLARVPLIIRTRHIDVDYPNPWLSRQVFTTLADHVLTTSDRINRHFQQVFHLPANRVTTLPTGIDLDYFSPTGDRAPLPGNVAGAPLIGMVSVLRSWKGHTTFLEAAGQLRAAGFGGRFVIVGEGPIRARIEQQIHELKLESSVTLAGHREDVPAVLRALDVLVIASTRHEGVPQIGLQALACKTPVVGSDVGGIPEIILEGKTGRIFPAQNAGALAGAIRTTLEQADRTGDHGRQGRRLVEEKYSLDHMLNQLEKLYEQHIPETQ